MAEPKTTALGEAMTKMSPLVLAPSSPRQVRESAARLGGRLHRQGGNVTERHHPPHFPTLATSLKPISVPLRDADLRAKH